MKKRKLIRFTFFTIENSAEEWSVYEQRALDFLHLTFEEDAHGTISGMRVRGPELLFGRVDQFFVREENPRENIVLSGL